jgi:hypothetical protein
MAEPTAYVSSEGGVNAFAFGLNKHSIILTSELIDLMNDRELEAIIAHELAHIMCEHMLYRDVSMALTNQALFPLKIASITSALVLREIAETTISALLLSWYRAAEYTADRAALLILDDAEAVAACLARLAGVPKRFLSEFDAQVFAEQLRNYEEEAPKWSKFVTWGMGAFRTHPEPVKRAAAILEWAKSKEYEDIRAGRYVTRFEAEMAENQIEIEGVAKCVLCPTPVGDNAVCPKCGMIQDPQYHVKCEKGHLNSVSWKFCKTCGAALGDVSRSDRSRQGSGSGSTHRNP